LREAHVEPLRRAGLREIIVARFEPGDVDENQAALRIARKMAGDRARVEAPFTGRSNLFARQAGALLLDARAIDAANAIHESITVATLPQNRAVTEGEMIATVKIIPFAVEGALLARALDAVAPGAVDVSPFRPMRVGVISTTSGLKPSVIEKTLRALESRLAPANASIALERRVPHETEALAEAIRAIEPECDLIVIFGATAITDRRDVIPAAVDAAGGVVERLGMPVDPGNLLLLARSGAGKPLLGAPGCARSPKENGFDWVLQRILAGLPIRSDDIRRMGVGGLLMEIVSRPQRRASPSDDVSMHATRLERDD
jgi:molybdenum cofactor cytidylyltransferase